MNSSTQQTLFAIEREHSAQAPTEIRPARREPFFREISVASAARILCTSIYTIYRLIEEGTVQAYQIRQHGWHHVSFDSVQAHLDRIRRTF